MSPSHLLVDYVVILRLAIIPTHICLFLPQPISKEGAGYANYGAMAENSSVDEQAVRCEHMHCIYLFFTMYLLIFRKLIFLQISSQSYDCIRLVVFHPS